jgi:hypothetical protein
MKSTVVEMTCVSKKEGFQYGNPGSPKETVIELAVPYGDSVFHKLSGGTNQELRTINQDAADMFVIGGVYVMTLTPKETVAEAQPADAK